MRCNLTVAQSTILYLLLPRGADLSKKLYEEKRGIKLLLCGKIERIATEKNLTAERTLLIFYFVKEKERCLNFKFIVLDISLVPDFWVLGNSCNEENNKYMYVPDKYIFIFVAFIGSHYKTVIKKVVFLR